MKLQVEQAKEHIGKKFPYSYTIPTSELGDVTAFPWSRHDITINGEFWFDGQNYIVQGLIESKGAYECSRSRKSLVNVEMLRMMLFLSMERKLT